MQIERFGERQIEGEGEREKGREKGKDRERGGGRGREKEEKVCVYVRERLGDRKKQEKARLLMKAW